LAKPRSRIVLHASWFAAWLALIAQTAFASGIPLPERRSGYDFMSRETRAMQDDDSANPAMLWVLDGEKLWNAKAGAAALACADCHGDARASMKGVALRYPAFSTARARPLNLAQQINVCRSERQQAAPHAFESRDLLALAAYVGSQSRGLPIAPQVDERTKPFLEAGRAAYHRRQGQLNLSCAQCHDDNWDKRLAGNAITQGHPGGYPLYRLEWQGLGSLQRRLRNCLAGVRAQPYDYGDAELVNLELFLMWRARGMKLETPAVRP
jgi:sulfur-oxidizing protein SoxA